MPGNTSFLLQEQANHACHRFLLQLPRLSVSRRSPMGPGLSPVSPSEKVTIAHQYFITLDMGKEKWLYYYMKLGIPHCVTKLKKGVRYCLSIPHIDSSRNLNTDDGNLWKSD